MPGDQLEPGHLRVGGGREPHPSKGTRERALADAKLSCDFIRAQTLASHPFRQTNVRVGHQARSAADGRRPFDALGLDNPLP